MNNLFKALNDKTRRKIIELLKNGDLSAGEIADEFDMTKSSISHHLEILKRADLVTSEKKVSSYSIHLIPVCWTICSIG